MNFLAPMAFWFAAVLPVVVLFYLLKRRRVARLVPSTLLWQKFLAETQASAPFQRLRHNWLLILQLLLLLLAILALARPYFSGKSTGGRRVVVILDASASMQSTDESPSRFEKARAEALRLVDSLHDTDEMIVLQSGATTEVKQSPTREKAALRRALRNAVVTDSPTRLEEGLKLAETLIRNIPKAEVHLFSDGGVTGLEELENTGLPLEFHRVGQRSQNFGIVTLDVRPNPENAEQKAIFTSVGNFSTNRQETQLELRFDDQLLEVKTLKLGPRETIPQVFIANQTKDGIYSVSLTTKDDLPVDDRASVVSLMPQPIRVLLVSSGNALLAKALRAAPNVELGVASTITDAESDFDITVIDNVTPGIWPAGNILAIRSANTGWFDGMGRLEGPAIVDWKASHPLLRFASFDNVQIAETVAIKTPSWAISLVDSPQTPLIIAGELGRQRIIWVGFDVLQSTWPLRISFPIFIANAVDWLNPAAQSARQLSVQAGTPFRMALAGVTNAAQIKMPDGTAQAVEINTTRGELVFGDTARRGVYHLQAGTNELAFCVNLLDAVESDTTPRSEVKLGKYNTVTDTPFRRANLEVWRWIAAAALAVLLFEWWYYHRRTA